EGPARARDTHRNRTPRAGRRSGRDGRDGAGDRAADRRHAAGPARMPDRQYHFPAGARRTARQPPPGRADRAPLPPDRRPTTDGEPPMTAQKGAAFLLKIGDGAQPPAYRTVAGLRTTQMSINGDMVIVTHKGSGGWREILSGAGTRSVSVSAAGIFLGSEAEAAIRAHALAGTIDEYELSFEDGERLRGRFA